MGNQRRGWTSTFASLVSLSLLINPVVMVKQENFKKCDQSGFCVRQRAYADEAIKQGSSWASPYVFIPDALQVKYGVVTGAINKKLVDATRDEDVGITFSVAFLKNGAARVTFDEFRRQEAYIELRQNSTARLERYNEAAKWTLVGGLATDHNAAALKDVVDGYSRFSWGEGNRNELSIRHDPFAMEFKRDGEVQIQMNERGLMNIEHWRLPKKSPASQDPPKTTETKEAKTEGGDDDEADNDEDNQETASKPSANEESNWWEESFGGNTDSKPRGPESVGMDFTFPGFDHVYGIPEHAGPMNLKETRGGDGNYQEPYRLYNLDVFEYELDSPMALYGAIPFMQAHKPGSSVGVFVMNSAEMWIDIVKSKAAANPLSFGVGSQTDTKTHWFAESGTFDFFVFLGPTPKENIEAYGQLTGYQQLPPLFSIAYHQCRWNYITDQDVRDVDRKFDKAQIPYDVIWLDIEYTDGKKYFTWDPLTFPDPIGMQKQLDEHERKLVAIIDPHIKKEDGYFVVDELTSKGLGVKDKNGELYQGWCWPGASHWIDCFNPDALTWWKSLYKYSKFKGSASNMFMWNDMNEPSVFNGPETTMPKDNLHFDNWEHRDVHNLNGLTFIKATYDALLERENPSHAVARQRPFVLTRSFYAGSQRLGAMWTGDNLAEWGHLEASLPMILNNGISGFPFAGADVGGFFGNPDKELLTRWYQAGAFYPFFRAHAHIDTRRREPYLAGAPYTAIITQALRLRYSLLPTWYTAFHTASTHGHPIVRPNWWVHPSDEKGFALDDQMYLGDSGLLVKPVTKEGSTSVDIYLADAATYYDYFDYTVHSGSAKRTVKIDAPLEKLPLLMQSGNIFARRDRPRRSSGLMKNDPFTLVVVLDQNLGADAGVKATGELYFDDGETFRYTEGSFIHRRFEVTMDAGGKMRLRSEDIAKPGSKTDAYLKAKNKLVVEKIVIIGAPTSLKPLKTVSINEESKGSTGGGSRKAKFAFEDAKDGRAAWAIVKNPIVSIGAGWKIDFE